MPKSKEPTVADLLKYMKRLLRKGWTQGASARSKSGRAVITHSPRAVAFCLLGAETRAVVEYASGDWVLGTGAERLIYQCLPTPETGIVAFNDATGRTQKEILNVVDCAIAKAASA